MILPEHGSIKPKSTSNKVVFPDPEIPTNPIDSPTFISKLASVYIEDPGNYNQELDIIKSEQGQVNEADIIDKYTGIILINIMEL